MATLAFSLVIPCYNEARNLPLLAERADALVAATGAEIVLVNNGSSDDSQPVMDALLATRPGFRTVHVPVNKGYGHGICEGLRAATGDIIGWTHADLQTDPMDAARGFDFFTQTEMPQTLFVKGTRRGRPLADTVFTAGMSVFETLLMGMVLRDVNAQPTLFHRSFFHSWTDAPNDFALDLFALASAKRAGLTVERFPVHFGERAHGQSSWNTDWAAKQRFIKRTLDYSFKLRSQLV